jgi:hypothetical protein
MESKGYDNNEEKKENIDRTKVFPQVTFKSRYFIFLAYVRSSIF